MSFAFNNRIKKTTEEVSFKIIDEMTNTRDQENNYKYSQKATNTAKRASHAFVSCEARGPIIFFHLLTGQCCIRIFNLTPPISLPSPWTLLEFSSCSFFSLQSLSRFQRIRNPLRTLWLLARSSAMFAPTILSPTIATSYKVM